MSNRPLVSVVTPVYNGERYLADCIESVLGQSYENFEYVVLENASTDGSARILERYAGRDPRIRLHRNDETLPFVENWNRALRLMSPDARYCKIVHADDWLYPDCVECMVELAQAHPTAGLVGSYVQRGDRIVCRWPDAPEPIIPGRELARLALLGRIPYLFGSPSSLLLHADLVRARQGFYTNEDLPLIQQVVDQDVCYRSLRESDFGYLKRPLSFIRDHGGSLTSGNERVKRWYPGKIMLLRRYGPVYLRRDEYDRRLDHWMNRYYRFLGKNVFRARDSAFWDYHRHALEQLGTPLQPVRLWRAAASQLYRRMQRRLLNAIPATASQG